MKLKDFYVSGDTIIWMILLILLFGIVCSYHIGFKDGVDNEKIKWLEQQEFDRKEKENA